MSVRFGIFSDLHLAPSPTNRCGLSPPELLRFFDAIEDRVDQIVVNGDLFDLSRPERLGDWADHLSKISLEFPEVLERLSAYDWTHGNHDRPLEKLGVPASRCYDFDSWRVEIRHGHQSDGGLKRLPGLETSANFFAGWCHRLGRPEVSI